MASMTPASLGQPAVGLGPSVVGHRMAVQPTAQDLGVGGLAQPNQGRPVQLAGLFPTTAQTSPNLGKGQGAAPSQPIALADHRCRGAGKLCARSVNACPTAWAMLLSPDVLHTSADLAKF